MIDECVGGCWVSGVGSCESVLAVEVMEGCGVTEWCRRQISIGKSGEYSRDFKCWDRGCLRGFNCV